MKDLPELYIDYVMNLQDSAEHKNFMLNSDKCYYEWLTERQEDGC